MDSSVRSIGPAYVVANHPIPTIQRSRHKSRIECVEKGPKMWRVYAAMKALTIRPGPSECDDNKCGENKWRPDAQFRMNDQARWSAREPCSLPRVEKKKR